MKIDLKKLPFEDFETLRRNGLISDEEAEAAKKAAGSDFQFNFWHLTIKDLGLIMEGKLPERILDLFSEEHISTAEFLKRNNAFEKFIEEYCGILDGLKIKETAAEKQAQVGLPVFMNHEGLLVFARSYFGLRNFTEAEEITLADLYLAKKDTIARQRFERNMSEAISRKIKTPKR